MPARVAFQLDDLSPNIPRIFEQVQSTVANHQKNYVALYKLHTEAAKHTEPIKNGNEIRLTGERAFEDIFLSMLIRALPIKKGASVVDRIIKFVGGYTKFINEKGALVLLMLPRVRSPSGDTAIHMKTKETQGVSVKDALRHFVLLHLASADDAVPIVETVIQRFLNDAYYSNGSQETAGSRASR